MQGMMRNETIGSESPTMSHVFPRFPVNLSVRRLVMQILSFLRLVYPHEAKIR